MPQQPPRNPIAPQRPSAIIPIGGEVPASVTPIGGEVRIDTDLNALLDALDTGKDVPHKTVAAILDWLPALFAGGGGIIGGIAGGAPSGGIGALPGATSGAALGGSAGEAVKQLINRFVGNPAPETATDAATAIGQQGAVQGATELVGGGIVSPMMQFAGKRLMQSAAKPGASTILKNVKTGETPEAVKFLLDQGVNVSDAGIAKLNRILTATNDEIKTVVSGLKGHIYPEAVAARVDDVTARARTQVNPLKDVADAAGAKDEFLATRAGADTRPLSPMSPAEAQALKQGTYRSLGDKAYGQLSSTSIEAQKALARGLKEDIASEAAKVGVDLTKLNAKEAAAIQTKEAVARRLAVAGNRDPVALAWLASNPVAGMASILERSPAVKSLLARGLYSSAANAANLPENTLRLMITAIATGKD